MPNITSITGADWPTSGTATTVTTGLDELTGTNLVHVGSTDVPTGSLSTGYVHGDENTELSFKITPNASIFNSDNDHWDVYNFRGRVTGTLPADPQGSTHDLHFVHNPTGNIRLRTRWHARTSDIHKGMIIFQNNVNLVQTPGDNFYNQLFNNSGFNSTIPFNKWNQFVVHIHKDATDGRYALYFNGVLIYELSGIDTTELGDTALQDDWNFVLDAVPGITWDIAGPFESWNGSDISIRPKWNLIPSASYTKEMWGIDIWNDNQFPQGRFWRYEGDATITIDEYGSPSNRRKRAHITGTDGQSAYLTSYDEIGTPPYATNGGWASILFKQVYSNGNATVEYAIRNAANTADVVRLTVNSSNQLLHGNTVLHTLSSSIRYNLCVHFNSDGSLRWSLFDVTTVPSSTQKVFGGSLGTWTPQALGIVTQGCVLHSGSAEVDFDGIDVCEWVECVGIDSLVVSSGVSGLTPTMASQSRLTLLMAHDGNHSRLPGGDYGLREHIETNTSQHRVANVFLGWSGTDREAEYETSIGQYLNLPRGCIFTNFDGGSINDILSNTPVTDAASRDAKAAAMSAALQSQVTLATSVGNMILLSTMMRRENHVNYSELQVQAINIFNEEVKRIARESQTNGLIQLSDAVTYIGDHKDQFPVDDVHPNATGEENYMEAFWANITTPADVTTTTTTNVTTLNQLYLKLDQTTFSRGDRGRITGTIYTDRELTTPMDLTGFTVTLRMFRRWHRHDFFNKTATIVSATGGTFSYSMGTGEIIHPGIFLFEVELTDDNDVISTNDVEVTVKHSPS